MKHEVDSIFLFIAELTGSFIPGTGGIESKIKCGQQDYIKDYLPELDLAKEEDRKDLHEVLWLKRIYNELDGYFNVSSDKTMRYLALDLCKYKPYSYRWTVPIETDASASMLQYEAILLNDKRLMEMTNIVGETLNDPWKLEGLSRAKLKKAATPMLYGSSQSCHELWQNAKLKYTLEDIAIYNKEINEGPLGLANLFKEFIINNVKPKAEMMVNIYGNEFTISCNRFRNIGEKTKAYKIFDSVDKRYNLVLHTDTVKIPDLSQFRRYFITLLIHGLDSIVADKVINKVVNKYGWGIPIHDAFLISPTAAEDCRKWYAQELQDIHENRDIILTDYFNSIGITYSSKQQWNALIDKVVPYEGKLEVNKMALK